MFFKSLTGGKQQDYRNDFASSMVSNALKDKGLKPAGLPFAIEEDTKLVVLKNGSDVKVNIAKRNALLFLGDLDHCGAKYNRVHYRIHVALPVDGIFLTRLKKRMEKIIIVKVDVGILV